MLCAIHIGVARQEQKSCGQVCIHSYLRGSRRDAAIICRQVVALTIRQRLAPTPGSLLVIRLGVIGGPRNADSHSLANPVGQVAGATTNRTPPLACSPEPGGAKALPRAPCSTCRCGGARGNCGVPACIHSYVG